MAKQIIGLIVEWDKEETDWWPKWRAFNPFTARQAYKNGPIVIWSTVVLPTGDAR